MLRRLWALRRRLLRERIQLLVRSSLERRYRACLRHFADVQLPHMQTTPRSSEPLSAEQLSFLDPMELGSFGRPSPAMANDSMTMAHTPSPSFLAAAWVGQLQHDIGCFAVLHGLTVVDEWEDWVEECCRTARRFQVGRWVFMTDASVDHFVRQTCLVEERSLMDGLVQAYARFRGILAQVELHHNSAQQRPQVL